MDTTGQRTGQVRAHRDLVPTHRLEVVHVVEARDFERSDRGHLQISRDEIDQLARQPALLDLGYAQGRLCAGQP